MDSVETEAVNRKVLLAWTLAQGVLGLGTLLIIVLTPSSAGRSAIFGLSWARLGITLVFLLATIVPILLAVRLRRASSEVWRRVDTHVTGRRWRYLAAAWALITVGLILLTIRAVGVVQAIAPAVTRLQPAAVWMLLTGGATSVAVLSLSRRNRDVLAWGLLVAITLVGITGHVLIWPEQESLIDDVYYVFRDGGMLRAGANPYERVLETPGEDVRKPAAYLPPVFLVSAGIQSVGFDDFFEWVAVWRIVSLTCAAVIAATLFLYAYFSQRLLLGSLGALLWMFNRWTLRVSQSADVDFLPVAFLVLALVYLSLGARRSLLLLGISLAIKHLAILLSPLFLIVLWRSRPRPTKKDLLFDALSLGVVPLAFSLPFLLMNADAFIRSILHSLTRDPQASGQVVALDGLLGWEGLAARLPMFALILLAYAGHARARWKPLMTALLVMAIVIMTNSVFFNSYMAWLVPLIPLAVVESLSGSSATGAVAPRESSAIHTSPRARTNRGP